MIRTILSVILFLLFSVSHAQENFCANGDKKLKANDFAGAMADYDAYIKLNESDALAFVKKREQYSKMTTYEIALADNGRVLEPMVECAQAYFGKAMCEKGLGNKAEALKDIELTINLNWLMGEAYYERALLKYTKEQKDDQCIDLRMGADLGCEKSKIAYEDNFCWNNSLNHYKEGVTKYNIHNYDAAIVDLDIALKLNPDSATTYVKRGQCYYGLAKYDLAIADFNLAIKKDANKAEAHYGLGLAYEAKDEHQKAFDAFSKAISSNSAYYEAFLNRAQTCENMSQFASAIYDYSSAIRLKPTNAELYFKRGVLKRDNLKNDIEACEDFGKASDLGYSDADELAKNCRNPYYKKPKEKKK